MKHLHTATLALSLTIVSPLAMTAQVETKYYAQPGSYITGASVNPNDFTDGSYNDLAFFTSVPSPLVTTENDVIFKVRRKGRYFIKCGLELQNKTKGRDPNGIYGGITVRLHVNHKKNNNSTQYIHSGANISGIDDYPTASTAGNVNMEEGDSFYCSFRPEMTIDFANADTEELVINGEGTYMSIHPLPPASTDTIRPL